MIALPTIQTNGQAIRMAEGEEEGRGGSSIFDPIEHTDRHTELIKTRPQVTMHGAVEREKGKDGKRRERKM